MTHLGTRARPAPGVFDYPIDERAAAEFLADPRQHIAVAIDDGTVVGFASAFHYFHPDKPSPKLFVNEVAVAPSHHRRGIGRAVVTALLGHARELGCQLGWVLTDRDNPAAMALYTTAGGTELSPDQVMFRFSTDP